MCSQGKALEEASLLARVELRVQVSSFGQHPREETEFSGDMRMLGFGLIFSGSRCGVCFWMLSGVSGLGFRFRIGFGVWRYLKVGDRVLRRDDHARMRHARCAFRLRV